MNKQSLAAHAISIEQTNLVKGGSPSASDVYRYGKKGYEVGKWVYDHRSQIASAAKTTYSAGKKVVKFVKNWF